MKELQQAIKFAKSWYGNRLMTGSPAKKDFIRFCAFSVSMAKIIFKDAKPGFDPRSQFAYASKPNIVLPGFYFSSTYLERLGIHPENYRAISALLTNGSQIHEALHLKLSPISMLAFAEESGHPTRFKRLLNVGLFQAVVDVVEDIFTENYCRRHYPQLFGWLINKNDILLNSSRVEGYIEKLGGLTSPQVFLQICPFLKNIKNRKFFIGTPFEEVTDIFLSAANDTLTPFDRAEIMLKIWDHLIGVEEELKSLAMDSEPEADDEENSPGDPSDDLDRDEDEGGGIDEKIDSGDPDEKGNELNADADGKTDEISDDQDMSLEERPEANITEDSIGEAEDTNEEDFDEESSSTPGNPGPSSESSEPTEELDGGGEAGYGLTKSLSELEDLADELGEDEIYNPAQDEALTGEEMEEMIGDIESDTGFLEEVFEELLQEQEEILKNNNILSKSFPKKTITDVMSYRASPEKLEKRQDFQDLARIIQSMLQENHTPGPSSLVGKINRRRIHRIATDGKIMSRNARRSKKSGHGETIVLGDFSGSMIWGRLYIRMVNALYSMFEEFRNARLPIAVYGHSSLSFGNQNCMVINIASNLMKLGSDRVVTTNDYKNRFERAMNIPKVQNWDGVAIDHVSQFFSEKAASKNIFVFSDGSPYGGRMYGEKISEQHTLAVINRQREEGVNIVSFSLTSGVMPSNDRLYGKEKNVNVSSDGLLGKNLRSTILKAF